MTLLYFKRLFIRQEGEEKRKNAFCFPAYSFLSSQTFCSGDKRTGCLNGKWTLLFLATELGLPTHHWKEFSRCVLTLEEPGNSFPPLHRAPAAAGKVLLLLLMELQMVWLLLKHSKDQIQRRLYFKFQSLHEPVKLDGMESWSCSHLFYPEALESFLLFKRLIKAHFIFLTKDIWESYYVRLIFFFKGKANHECFRRYCLVS